MPFDYHITIEDPQQRIDEHGIEHINFAEFDVEYISHKRIVDLGRAKHDDSELQVGREWKIIETQKHFWAISNEIETSERHLLFKLYKAHSKFTMEIELRRSFIRGPTLVPVATLKFVALVKGVIYYGLEYYGFYFQINGTPAEKDEPE